MQDITELERRIAAAFDRIDRGLEQADRARATVTLPSTEAEQPATVQTSALLRSLESAQASSADWAKRYAALEAQLADVTLSMAAEITKLTDDLTTTRADLQMALVSPDQPQQSATELQALEAQLTDLRRQLAAQSVELLQLRAQRATEIEELKSIVAALTPLIEEAKPHA